MRHRGGALRRDTGPERGLAPMPKETPRGSHHSCGQLSINHDNRCISTLTGTPLGVVARAHPVSATAVGLYTADERRRRDASPWTVVQAVLAPIQFVICLVSVCLVLRYLTSGAGLALANASVVVKTAALYAIMITGSIWERDVFGRYLFARPFFWEDLLSLLVLTLHTTYLIALTTDTLGPRHLMLLALAAYAAYAINATQFVLKLRAARQQRPAAVAATAGLAS